MLLLWKRGAKSTPKYQQGGEISDEAFDHLVKLYHAFGDEGSDASCQLITSKLDELEVPHKIQLATKKAAEQLKGQNLDETQIRSSVMQAVNNPDSYLSAKPEPKEEPETPKLKITNNIRAFMPHDQLKAIHGNDEIAEPIAELDETIQNMPETYGQDGKGKQAIAYLHYFTSDSDWFITEKDAGSINEDGTRDDSQSQAFGYVSLGHYPEMGYISIEQLKRMPSVQLDLYWEPKTIEEIDKEFNFALGGIVVAATTGIASGYWLRGYIERKGLPKVVKEKILKNNKRKFYGLYEDKSGKKRWKEIKAQYAEDNLQIIHKANSSTYIFQPVAEEGNYVDQGKNTFKSDSEFFYELRKFEKGGETWIQETKEEMEEKQTIGAFTKQALRHQKTPVEFAKDVLANPEKYQEKTRKRAQFVKNVNPEKFEEGGETTNLEDEYTDQIWIEGSYADGDDFFEEQESFEDARTRFQIIIDEDIFGEIDFMSLRLMAANEEGEVLEFPLSPKPTSELAVGDVIYDKVNKGVFQKYKVVKVDGTKVETEHEDGFKRSFPLREIKHDLSDKKWKTVHSLYKKGGVASPMAGRKIVYKDENIYVEYNEVSGVYSIRDTKTGQFMKAGGAAEFCQVGTQVQTLIFDKSKYANKDKAKRWAKAHGFKYGKVDEKENTFRLRQQEPDSFRKDSFRTISFKDGLKAVIACPKNIEKKQKGGEVKLDPQQKKEIRRITFTLEGEDDQKRNDELASKFTGDTYKAAVDYADSLFKSGGEADNSHRHTYMMLGRLQSDNDYFLGAGKGSERHLWAGNVDDQIAEMKKLWNSLPEDGKPEWLSMEEIEDYENKMKNYGSDTFEKGGEIIDQYEGMTAEEVWNSWSLNQREHFLLDHLKDNYNETSRRVNATKKWNNKRHPRRIKEAVKHHVEEGQYKYGGKVY